MELQKIKEMFKEDVKIDDLKLGQEALQTTYLHSKYINILLDEEVSLRALNVKMDKLKRDRFKFYSGYSEIPFEIGLETAKEIQIFLEGDEEFCNLKGRVALQEEKVKYLKNICTVFEKRGFAVKNAMDWEMFQAGGR